MSGSGPQISGSMSKLKPWHYALIVGAGIAAMMFIPTIGRLKDSKKIEDTTAATLAAGSGNIGEPWHEPSLPVAERDVRQDAVFKPTATAQPQPQPGLVPQAPIALPGASAIPDYRMFGQRQQPSPPPQQQPEPGAPPQGTRVAAGPDGSMAALLKPTETEGYRATRMAHPWATIEQGRIIACNSVTPMTSELPGFVKAKVSHDVMSADGTTTLIDRNSTIFGEIAHGLAAGQERLFVLWHSVLTPPPDLVRITLNSPAADELGESGLPGDVNHHTWKRIGGALMLSGADALLQGIGAGIGSALSHGNSNGNSAGSNLNFYQFQSQGSSLASSLLQHTVEIPDVLHRDQALPCSIFTSGDLDFSAVYRLRRNPQ